MNNNMVERNVTIKQLYNDGKTMIEIARQYGLSKERIRQIIKEDKDKSNDNDKSKDNVTKKKRRGFDIDLINQLIEGKISKTQFGEKYGMTVPAVQMWMNRAGIKIQENYNRRKDNELMASIYKEYLDGLGAKFLAKKYGMSRRQMEYRLAAYRNRNNNNDMNKGDEIPTKYEKK